MQNLWRRIKCALNPEQWRVFFQALFSASGPVSIILIKQVGLDELAVTAWLQIASLLTPVFGGAWMVASRTNVQQVQAVAAMPTDAKVDALKEVNDATKVRIAAAVPDVQAILVKNNGSKLAKVAHDLQEPKVVIDPTTEPPKPPT